MKRILLIAGLSLLATPALAQAKYPIAADGTTNVADCIKAPADVRNDCISRSRPMNNKALMDFTKSREATVVAPTTAAPAKAARIDRKAAKAAEARHNKARVASAPKGLKVAADGSTNIRQCATVGAKLFNECVSRARALTGKQLAVYTKERSAAAAKLAAAAPKSKVAAKAEPKKVEAKVAATKVAATKAAPAKILDVKGFVVAKDGTTNIADCAKAKPDFKNECISRARPLTGAEVYGKPRS